MSFTRFHAILSGAFVALSAFAVQAQVAYEGRAPNILVTDFNTGQILVDRNADVPLPPASMSKLMTLNMLFEAIDDGRVDMDTTFTVSERAHAMGGSRMFLETRHRPTAEDLIRGIAVLSGNDATVVVAEGLAGSEEAFAQLATARARQLGMTNTTLRNASGWPDPEHRMSLRDLAVLARHLLEEHGAYYPYLAEREFTWNNITQPNRVPLLGAGLGLDGLKTGHTSEAGYALTGSAVQGDRRVIFVFSGLDSERERTEEAERIINWAFRQFAEQRIADQGQVLAEATVWMGDERSVALVAPRDYDILVPVFTESEITAQVVYDGPIAAPITEGQELARLIVSVPGSSDFSLPLVAGHDVAEGGFVPRMRSAATVLAGHLGLVIQ
ncbi:MAG: D-alanyl-D-alanine carboxypeptidase [Pararhodobacter sp.]|nr:D-alanyl-D-alanine carboxypeptidase [Pararhodobacter sp.]